MELFSTIVETVNAYLWGIPMVTLLFRAHLYLTIRTRFTQRETFIGIRLSVIRDPDSSGDINQLAALTTVLVSTISTGNIIEVGAAVALGSPGAVLWCWLTGVFGIATRYGEPLIAVKYGTRAKNGTMLGGAMYALEHRLNTEWLGITFAVLGTLTSLGIGRGVQVNAISSIADSNVKSLITSEGLKDVLDTHPWLISLAMGPTTSAITCLVIFGGAKPIARACEKLVSLMAFFYVIGCLIILFINQTFLGETSSVILRSAFTEVRSTASGLVGSGIMMSTRYSIARDLFSNESGMESTPIAATTAQIRNPVRQALISATRTFRDTMMVCLMTGLVLVSSIIGHDPINVTDLSGGELTNVASSLTPYISQPVLTVGIIAFAYSTILGWSYYGERCLEYLMGERGVIPYRLTWAVVLVAAPIIQLELVWSIVNTLNTLTTIPNLIAVLLLFNVIVKDTKYYLKHLDERNETLIPLSEDQNV